MELSAAFGDVLEKIIDLHPRWKVTAFRKEQAKDLWIFKKNMAALSLKGHPRLPTLVYFTLQYAALDVKGLPLKRDAMTLKNIEDNILPDLQEQAVCLYVGQVFKAGIKDHLFYVSDAKIFLDCVNSYEYALGNLQVHLEQVHDPQWQLFEEFPGN